MMILCFSMIGISIVIGIMASIIVYDLKTEPGYHPWPSVTRCKICEERIYVWQRYERRESGMNLDNPQGVAVFASSSSLYHTGCKGTVPLEASISISVPQPANSF